MSHLHKCPECHACQSCDMDCTTYPNEHGARIGGVVTCRCCSSGWSADGPTPGKWWLSVHPQERGRVAWDASPVLACNVSGQIVEIESRTGSRIATKRFHLADAFLVGAQWQVRETPTDPFSPTPLSSDGTR